MYTYQPLVPIAAARSYLPYQPAPKYLNDPLSWQRAYPIPHMNDYKPTPIMGSSANKGHAAALTVTAAAVTQQNQNAIKPSQTSLNMLNEDISSTKIVPTAAPTTTPVPTVTTTEQMAVAANNEVSIDRIDNGESSSSSSTSSSSSSFSVANSQSNAVNQVPPAVHVTLPHYSQPLPEHVHVPHAPHAPHAPHMPHHLPYMANYQNPHVQYMPCMCPVSMGIASEVLPAKQVESREDGFDAHVVLADDFEN